MERATWRDLESARRGILTRRQAVLQEGGERSQELATRLWSDAVNLEGAIARLRWAP